ncbi:Mechanosensitive ion channel [Sphingobacterium wenxiniae]|uniref:Mechanosensitive ion channel n=2 Tax=Sphingobacterium wenxiniae TaxID=683125 RepID=A0A1I6VTV7_9SPHI|nr:Mechanosensitive ion channel [Sphingobacterium wenxiniae]
MNNLGYIRKTLLECAKIFQIIIITLFVAGLSEAQESDSLTKKIEVRENQTRQMVHHWQTRVKLWDKELDSLKHKLSWGKYTKDTLFMDSVLVYLGGTKTEVNNLSQVILQAKQQKRIFEGLIDSSGIAEHLVSDSTTVQFVGLTDTLRRIESNLGRLLTDIDYLQSTVSKQLEEAKTMVDKPITPRRLSKTMQKNLAKDGLSPDYFALSAWGGRILLVLCSFLYFYWLLRIERKSEQGTDTPSLQKSTQIWVPALKACIFFLVLLPFTSFTIPVVVLEVSYFLIFLMLYILVYRELSPFKHKVLNSIFIYYLILLGVNLFLSELWWSRSVAVLTNLLAIGLIWGIGKKATADNPMGYMHKYARWALILGNVLAIISTLIGHLDSSRMWSLAAGIGLLQAISLRSFREMLLRDMENHYNRADKESMIKRFDLDRLLNSFGRLLRFCAVLLVILALLNNLHSTREAAGIWDKIFSTPRQIGGVQFTYGNLVLAIAVIWTANWFQKNLANLLTNPSTTDLHRQKMALFPLFRLLIMVVGFLFGISILGLGLDKLTVIIGALSVGIGLGLQNIINNFVSGIILVFEKPFKIGDFVEIGDKKGQVMQIGIRSSTLLTDQGARIIIPNGDLLSGRLVNWTFSDSDIRLNMQLTVQNTVDLKEWKEWLKQTIYSFDEVDSKVPLKIWTKDVTADNYQIALQVGIKHMRLIERFRSRFLETVKKEMDAKQVKVTSS